MVLGFLPSLKFEPWCTDKIQDLGVVWLRLSTIIPFFLAKLTLIWFQETMWPAERLYFSSALVIRSDLWDVSGTCQVGL